MSFFNVNNTRMNKKEKNQGSCIAELVNSVKFIRNLLEWL